MKYIAQTASKFNRLLTAIAVSSILSGCGGSDSSSTIQPAVKPTSPVVKPAVPVVEPNPTVEPSKPIGEPTRPVVEPSKPAVEPSKPVGKPTVNNDTIPPKIELLGSKSISIALGDTFVDPGFLATDNVDDNIINQVKISGDIDTDRVGQYVLVYSVNDSAGNKAEVTRIVKVIEGLVFRDSKVTLYENEYQHRIWFDLQLDSMDSSDITFELANQNSAEHGKDFDLSYKPNNSFEKSGYFTLAIHDDDEFERKEQIIVKVLNKGKFIKELEITLDDTDSGDFVEHGKLLVNKEFLHQPAITVLNDKLYFFNDQYSIEYDMINNKVEKLTEIGLEVNKADGLQIGTYKNNLFLFASNKLYRFKENDLSWEIYSESPEIIHRDHLNTLSHHIIGDKLYLFGDVKSGYAGAKPNDYRYDFTNDSWDKLISRPPNQPNYPSSYAYDFNQTAEMEGNIFMFWSENAAVYNAFEDTWSKPFKSPPISRFPVITGKYVYSIKSDLKSNYTISRVKLSLTKPTNEDRKVSRGAFLPFMYKGRIYILERDNHLLSFYWGDNYQN